MAIVEQPLAAVIAAPQIRNPRQLEGQKVGVTGVPSDTAVLHSIVAGAGGDPAKVKTVTIGFNAVPALLAHRVAAATAFWNDEGVTLQRTPSRFSRLPRRPLRRARRTRSWSCAPPGRRSATTRRWRARVVRALVRGYGVTLTDPEGSAADLESEVPGLDPKLVAAQLERRAGRVHGPGWRVRRARPKDARSAGPQWEAKFGIVKQPPNVDQAFDPEFVRGTASLIGN